MSRIFKHATLINPAEKLNQTGSIKLSDDGILQDICFGEEELPITPEDEVIDFSDGLICSGFFDMHVHFRQPGQEYKETLETGALAAQAGGYTGVAIMPNTTPAIDNEALVHFIRHKSLNFPVEIEIIGCITAERKGEKIANYGELKQAGICAVSDDGDAVMNSNVMKMAFEYASSFNLPIIQHCEDKALSAQGKVYESQFATLQGIPGIPYASESIILARDLFLLREFLETKGSYLNHKPAYHVAHISSAYSLELVRQAKKDGLPITCEVTPHHFTLTDEDMYNANYDGNFCMKPPLVSKENRHAILEAITDGTIDAIATDHAPHAWHEKNEGLLSSPFGIVGLETAVGLTFTELVHTQKISPYRAVELLSTEPRKILRLESIKFEKEKAANLTFVLPNQQWQVDSHIFKSKSYNTPFNNRNLTGKAIGTCAKGHLNFNQSLTTTN